MSEQKATVVGVACPDLKEMADWIKEPEKDGSDCKPCLLGVVAQWYRDILQEAGNAEAVARIERISDNPEATPESLCEEFDRIKRESPEELQKRLQDFDCSAQLYIEGKEVKHG